jgi:hypothetical protein
MVLQSYRHISLGSLSLQSNLPIRVNIAFFLTWQAANVGFGVSNNKMRTVWRELSLPVGKLRRGLSFAFAAAGLFITDSSKEGFGHSL